MNDLETRIEKRSATEAPRHPSREEATAHYYGILMRILEEAKREFDKWPDWKKQYSITTRKY